MVTITVIDIPYFGREKDGTFKFSTSYNDIGEYKIEIMLNDTKGAEVYYTLDVKVTEAIIDYVEETPIVREFLAINSSEALRNKTLILEFNGIE